MARKRKPRAAQTPRMALPKTVKVGRKYYRYRTTFTSKKLAREFQRRARRRGYGAKVMKKKIVIYPVYTRG